MVRARSFSSRDDLNISPLRVRGQGVSAVAVECMCRWAQWASNRGMILEVRSCDELDQQIAYQTEKHGFIKGSYHGSNCFYPGEMKKPIADHHRPSLTIHVIQIIHGVENPNVEHSTAGSAEVKVERWNCLLAAL